MWPHWKYRSGWHLDLYEASVRLMCPLDMLGRLVSCPDMCTENSARPLGLSTGMPTPHLVRHFFTKLNYSPTSPNGGGPKSPCHVRSSQTAMIAYSDMKSIWDNCNKTQRQIIFSQEYGRPCNMPKWKMQNSLMLGVPCEGYQYYLGWSPIWPKDTHEVLK